MARVLGRVTASALGAWLALVGASLVLLGWIVESEALMSLGPGSAIMLPITAIAFVVGGVALLLAPVRPVFPAPSSSAVRTRTAMGLAVTLTVLGVVMFAQRAAKFELAVNRILFPDQIARYPYRPIGLMAINSSLSFTLLGLALILLIASIRRERGPRRVAIEFSQLMSAIAFFIALTAVIGYVYESALLYSFERLSVMAFPTAACFVFLSVGVFAAHPDRGLASLVTGKDVSGMLTRPLLAAAVLVPVGLGWLWLLARRSGLLSREEGATLFVVLSILTFVVIVLRAARIVQRTDRSRERARAGAEHALAAAEAANRAKSEFLTVMSHELRTPLNAIAGHTQLLEMELHGPVTDAQREALARINRSQRQLLRLINDVLNFARVEAGRVEYHLTDVAVAEVVRDLDPMIAPQLAERGLSYSIDVDPSVFVRADREKVQQILLNLLSNAVKFTPRGGQVSVDSPIRKPSDEAPSFVFIRVRDSGIGIPRERLDSVFDPFVQIDSSLTRVNDGVGLGLSISRDLARAMGGDLRARSATGVGSTFTLALPMAGSALLADAASSA